METNTTDQAASPADIRAIYHRAVATATASMEAVRPDQLELPTPCDACDVRALLAHLVMVQQRVACAGNDTPAMEWPQDATHLADDEFVPAWKQAEDDVRAAWADDARLDATIALPWTALAGADVLAIYTNEVTMHTWDLAQATGQEPAWDPEVLAVADAAIHAELPDADRAPMWAAAQAAMPPGIPWSDPFANAVPIADDAPLIDRLAAWNGRTPLFQR